MLLLLQHNTRTKNGNRARNIISKKVEIQHLSCNLCSSAYMCAVCASKALPMHFKQKIKTIFLTFSSFFVHNNIFRCQYLKVYYYIIFSINWWKKSEYIVVGWNPSVNVFVRDLVWFIDILTCFGLYKNKF